MYVAYQVDQSCFAALGSYALWRSSGSRRSSVIDATSGLTGVPLMAFSFPRDSREDFFSTAGTILRSAFSECLLDVGVGWQAHTKVSPIPSSDGFPLAPLISYVEEIRI